MANSWSGLSFMTTKSTITVVLAPAFRITWHVRGTQWLYTLVPKWHYSIDCMYIRIFGGAD